MPDRVYSDRDVVDKLGIKPGHALVYVEDAGRFDLDLIQRALSRAGILRHKGQGPVDIVLAMVDVSTDSAALLRHWRERIAPSGAIWLVSPKRGQKGHVNQSSLIEAGLTAGLVDNKVCSVSDTTGAIRFVIRKRDR